MKITYSNYPNSKEMEDTNSLTITKRHAKCIHAAIDQAFKSPCLHKHGCVIAGSGRIYGKGYNNYRNHSSDGFLDECVSCHAEIAAIRDALRFGRLKVGYRERDKKGRRYKLHTLRC